MAKNYNCPHADIEWEGISCKKDGKPCGHVRWCMEKGRVILTEQALKCPLRSDVAKIKKNEMPETFLILDPEFMESMGLDKLFNG